MSDLPRITVIIPNLNQGYFLERAICSVLDQGYENLELIVMDGGSTDESIEILELYNDEIAHWQSLWDSGPAEAINTALSWATGDLVGILDADDAYLPDALSQVAAASEGQDWLVGQALRIDEDDNVLGDLQVAPANKLAGFLMDDGGEQLPRAVGFYRTAMLKAMGGFDSTMQIAYGYEMACRLYVAGERPTVLPGQLAMVREHDESHSASHALTNGHEFIDAGERYAEHLSVAERYLFWRNCDERRQVYTQAHLESASDAQRRNEWQLLLKRPWWLNSEAYRLRLLKQGRQADAA